MTKNFQLAVEIIYTSDQWREIDQLEPLVNRAARAAYKTAGTQQDLDGPHIVAINLSDDATIKHLNHSFRGKDKATNVLSFPFEDDFPEHNPDARQLGDIILAFETVALESEQQNKPFSHHIAHLVVHAVLHLFGYDHLVPLEAEEMEEIECQILATLEIPSPYRTR